MEHNLISFKNGTDILRFLHDLSCVLSHATCSFLRSVILRKYIAYQLGQQKKWIGQILLKYFTTILNFLIITKRHQARVYVLLTGCCIIAYDCIFALHDV